MESQPNPGLLADLDEALNAVAEMMQLERDEQELKDWRNKYLPLVKRHGYEKFTIEFI